MKNRIKNVVEICVAVLVGFMLMTAIMFMFFYIKVQFFPYEATYPNSNIEQLIYDKSY